MFFIFRFHGAIGLFFLLLQLLQTGRAQWNVGRCKCKETVVWSQDKIVKMFRQIIETNSCSAAITEIKFSRGFICGKTKDPWVQQIISCIKNDPKPCLKPTITPVPVTATSTLPPPSTSRTLLIVLSSSSSLSTTEPFRLAETFTSAASFATEPSHITGVSSIASTVTKSTTDSAAKNGAGEQRHDLQNTPTTATEKTKHQLIAIISLLGVVFILVGLVTFLICRRRGAKKQTYEAVETSNLENYVVV